MLDLMPLPELFPPYAGLLVADTGEIWVGDYPGQVGLWGLTEEEPPMPERSWLILMPTGEITGLLTTPTGFEPHAVRDGLVWGVHTDELNVESVRAYAIERD